MPRSAASDLGLHCLLRFVCSNIKDECGNEKHNEGLLLKDTCWAPVVKGGTTPYTTGPNVRKHTFDHLRPAKIQISLCVRGV